MKRRIIIIDEEKCNGCGICATACHEGAIDIVNHKAVLARENYCDGLGDCLPACPMGAISFEEREAPAYDHEAVLRYQQEKAAALETLPCGCPGTQVKTLSVETETAEAADCCSNTPSQLRQWPVQIKLLPPQAPFFQGADILIAADCTAYAYGNFHRDFITNRVVLIGCPKLDNINYAEKLTEIFKHNDVKSVTVVRMAVPCCGGMENAVKTALKDSGKELPYQIYVISSDGRIV